MISFPLLKHLSVTNFSMYPGKVENPGLHIDFRRGLTLVLGANGLGKTTLVNILYRLLAGAYDIPGLAGSAKLGNMALMAKVIDRKDKLTFASRVADGAAQAEASLVFQIGSNEFYIGRSLRTLDITSFRIDGVEQDKNEINGFQAAIQKVTGVSSFGDWILLLRHLVFYFEDRRALVWDASAQKEILRILFLPTEISRLWRDGSRDIVELDSRMRNLRNALNKEESSLSKSESQSAAGAATLQQVRALEDIQKVESEKLTQLEEEFLDYEALRENHRLQKLMAEQEKENASRAVERIKLNAIAASFPEMSDTMRFILSHLLTENECLVCNSQVSTVSQQYLIRIEKGHCVICDTPLAQRDPLDDDNNEDELKHNMSLLLESSDKVEWSTNQLADTEERYQNYIVETAKLEAKIRTRSVELNRLIKSLPPEEEKLRGYRENINKLNVRVAEQTKELLEKKQSYKEFVALSSRTIAMRAEPITESFNKYAKGFLIEDCQLVWSPQKLKVGETGEAIDFPAFDLRMTSADFDVAVVRSGPEQVSESQREFIDLAFRMAMMEIAGERFGSSLLIDAPESSLDAVFVTRAANVLTQFANNEELPNRLVIMSNLVDGRLIPQLISNGSSVAETEDCVINLFDIAAPTAAVKQLRPEYDKVLANLLETAKQLKAS